MDLCKGRLAPKPFALGVFAVWIAGIASQLLLTGDVIARGGLWPFIIAQAVLIAIWLMLHIRRLRDAGQGPAAAIGIALIYILSIGLLLMLVAFFTHPDSVGAARRRGPGEQCRYRHAAGGLPVQYHVHAGLRRVLDHPERPDPDRLHAGCDLAHLLGPHRNAEARAVTLYFAYGANMERAAMAKRCPGAQPLGPALLRGWRYVIAQGYGSVAPARAGTCSACCGGSRHVISPR